MVAFYEGMASFVLMLIFQVEGSLLFSVLLMIASFLPIVGATIVWIPVGLLLCITGSVLKGVIFLIIMGVVTTIMESFLRPMYLRDRINVHPLLIFFSILGGIKFFGINGLLLGPMVIILFFTVLDLLTEDSKSEGAVAPEGSASANASGEAAGAGGSGVQSVSADVVDANAPGGQSRAAKCDASASSVGTDAEPANFDAADDATVADDAAKSESSK